MAHHHGSDIQVDELEDHDLGLSHDLPTLLSRRNALTFLGGTGLIALAGCGSSADTTSSQTSAGSASSGASSVGASSSSSDTAASSSASSSAGATASTEIPEETGGPYPADGTNGPNVLTASGIVRSDITKSFGTASGVATGVPLTIKLTVLDVSNGAKALSGAAVYLWHCNIDGKYSLYSQGVTNENYLRGVQEADSSGVVTFKSIFPAAYSGRWPHIHFEVYPSLAKATTPSDKLRTTQLALPEAACKTVYATDGYSTSVTNLAQTSLATDNVFSDGYSLQLGTVTGTVTDGMTVTLNVPV